LNATSDLMTLSFVPGVSPRASAELLGRGPLAASLASAGDHEDLLGAEGIAALRAGTARRAAESEMERARKLGVAIVGRDEDRYPQWLRRTYTPPLVLWVRGSLDPDEGERAVAIVGSRAATPVGRGFAEALGCDLAAAGLVVVSGLARGIDAAAHRGALRARKRTVAVLGSGLDRLYPPEHDELAARIAATGGAVVSEFPLGARPWKSNFPRRNRVIAGWSRAVVVVEAGARSGALSTSRAALDEGRDVMAVPGHPGEPQAEGANALLKDGAALVRGAADVLAELGVTPQASEPAASDDAVLHALDARPACVDEIQERSGLALPSVLSRLAELELAGAVARLGGGLYARAGDRRGYTRP
jgi:DNA processing protein